MRWIVSRYDPAAQERSQVFCIEAPSREHMAATLARIGLPGYPIGYDTAYQCEPRKVTPN